MSSRLAVLTRCAASIPYVVSAARRAGGCLDTHTVVSPIGLCCRLSHPRLSGVLALRRTAEKLLSSYFELICSRVAGCLGVGIADAQLGHAGARCDFGTGAFCAWPASPV
jgi:hypothetical protein